MICLQEVKRYCSEYWLIENYDQAIADKSQTWHCHHRHEIDWALPREELIAIGRYYNVHYSELIFLTPAEHRRLHNAGENHPMYGKEGYWKGKEGPNKGRQFTEEWKQKMTKYHISVEDLYNLYVVQGFTQKHIAELLSCSLTCIKLKLKKYNIKKKAQNAPNYKYHITEEELYDLYVVQGLSTYKIAELLSCSPYCIKAKLKKYAIRKKPHKEASKVKQ